MTFAHDSIMVGEIIAALNPRAGATYADATLGGGGHSEALLNESAPDGRLIAIDQDLNALHAARDRLSAFGDRVRFCHAKFGAISEVLDAEGIECVDGVVADLGVSSPQLDVADRGFSFRQPGPIDMRMDQSQGATALELIGELSAEELADVIYEYGEEHRSRRIARSIRHAYEEGKLETTLDLRSAVIRAIGPKRRSTDPATKTFQALRIAVNHELDELRDLLDALPSILCEGGVVAVMSFQSLEDRMVKHTFRDSNALEPLTKRPLRAGEEEQARNPRSRSAKLRTARRTEVGL